MQEMFGLQDKLLVDFLKMEHRLEVILRGHFYLLQVKLIIFILEDMLVMVIICLPISRQIISGFPENGTSFRGYSSRAFLSSSSKVDYIYFGGYVGDGNNLSSDLKTNY